MKRNIIIQDHGIAQETVAIQTKLHLWWNWLSIAARNCGSAMKARSGPIEPMSFESEVSARLSREFESSIATISAVAFAMEALKREFGENKFQLDNSRFVKPKKTNAGFFLGQQLLQVFEITGEFANQLPVRLEKVFNLRNDSVHFVSRLRKGTKLHPSGQKSAEELTVFTAEECIDAIKLSHQILNECKLSVENGRFHSAANTVAKEFAGILSMFDEVLAHEGIFF